MSLVELLVVISVLGIISALFVPNIANISSQAHYAKNERNAQNIATLIASAKAAGVTNTWSTATQAITDLETGFSIPAADGSIELKISPMSEEEKIATAGYLQVVEGMIYYQTASN